MHKEELPGKARRPPFRRFGTWALGGGLKARWTITKWANFWEGVASVWTKLFRPGYNVSHEPSFGTFSYAVNKAVDGSGPFGGRGDITNPAGHTCGGRGGSASVHGNIQRMKSPKRSLPVAFFSPGWLCWGPSPTCGGIP